MQVNLTEALRYLGAEQADEALMASMRAVASELEQTARPKWRYRVAEVEHTETGELVAGLCLSGEMAKTMLSDCDRAALLICTLGAPFETLLRRKQARNMAEAAILDACGSAFVEVGCDAAEKEIAARFPDMYLTDRFSPGYGDLPLSIQPEFCAALDARRQLGITVTESLLMVPTKTVTAVIGISDKPQIARIRGCDFCRRRENCTFRKGGRTCGAS